MMFYVNSKLESLVQKIRPDLCARVLSGVFYLGAVLLAIAVVLMELNEMVHLLSIGQFLGLFVCIPLVGASLHGFTSMTLSPETFKTRSVFCICAAWFAAPNIVHAIGVAFWINSLTPSIS